MSQTKQLADYLIESGATLKKRGQTGITINGRTAPPKGVIRTVFDLVSDNLNPEDKGDLAVFCVSADNSDGEDLIHHIRANIDKKRQDEIRKDLADSLESDINFRYQKLVPIADIKTGERGLFDANKGQMSELDYETWYDRLPPAKEDKAMVMATEKRGRIEYNPYTLKSHQVIRFEGQEVYQFNSHIPPVWRLMENKPTLHPFFLKFMKHLFPKKKDREYVIQWMGCMLKDRNQTALLLVSNMGTGKNIFLKLCSLLVGLSNYQLQSEGFFRSQFNSELKDKRLIGWDETTLTTKIKESLKFLLNETITIEAKGKNVKGSIPNYSSFIIINNHLMENYILSNDRRFSVPDITDIKLLEVFDSEEVDEFMMALDNDDDIIRGIGQYVIEQYKGEDFNSQKAHTADKFFEMVVYSLAAWQRFIFNKVKDEGKDEYLLSDINIDYEHATKSRLFPSSKKVEMFLSNFRDKDGDRIGYLEGVGKDIKLVPSDKYRENDYGDI